MTTRCDRCARGPGRADFRFAQPDNKYKLIYCRRQKNAGMGNERSMDCLVGPTLRVIMMHAPQTFSLLS
jgi:hypothetical protein